MLLQAIPQELVLLSYIWVEGGTMHWAARQWEGEEVAWARGLIKWAGGEKTSSMLVARVLSVQDLGKGLFHEKMENVSLRLLKKEKDGAREAINQEVSILKKYVGFPSLGWDPRERGREYVFWARMGRCKWPLQMDPSGFCLDTHLMCPNPHPSYQNVIWENIWLLWVQGNG